MASANTQASPPDVFKLGKVLAAQEKETRDKGIEILESWLKQKQNPTELDYMKVWRALFYCMWMSDKPVVQYELAGRLATLLHSPPKAQDTILFVQTFFKTMLREWAAIDKFRYDKYLWLVRFFTNEYLTFLKNEGFDDDCCDALNLCLLETALNPESHMTHVGLASHLADIFLEEVVKVLGEDWYTQDLAITTTLYFPWLQCLGQSDNAPFVEHVSNEVFSELVKVYERLKDSAALATGKDAKKLLSRKDALHELLSQLNDMIGEYSRADRLREANRKALVTLHSALKATLATPSKKRERSSDKASEDPAPTTKKSKHHETEDDSHVAAPKASPAGKNSQKSKEDTKTTSASKDSPKPQSKTSTKSTEEASPSRKTANGVSPQAKNAKQNGKELSSSSDDAASDSSQESDSVEEIKLSKNKKSDNKKQIEQASRRKQSIQQSPSNSSSDEDEAQNGSDGGSIDDEDLIGSDADIDLEDLTEEEWKILKEQYDSGDFDEMLAAYEAEEGEEDGELGSGDIGSDDDEEGDGGYMLGQESSSSDEEVDMSSRKHKKNVQHENLVKMVKVTPPKKSAHAADKRSPSPSSKSPNGGLKRVSFSGQKHTEMKHTPTKVSPSRSILKPTPAGPVNDDFEEATAINSYTNFPPQYQYVPQTRILSRPKTIVRRNTSNIRPQQKAGVRKNFVKTARRR